MNKLRAIYEAIAHPPAAKELARRELESARRAYLSNQTSLEYFKAQVDFDKQRIARLEKYLSDLNG